MLVRVEWCLNGSVPQGAAVCSKDFRTAGSVFPGTFFFFLTLLISFSYTKPIEDEERISVFSFTVYQPLIIASGTTVEFNWSLKLTLGHGYGTMLLLLFISDGSLQIFKLWNLCFEVLFYSSFFKKKKIKCRYFIWTQCFGRPHLSHDLHVLEAFHLDKCRSEKVNQKQSDNGTIRFFTLKQIYKKWLWKGTKCHIDAFYTYASFLSCSFAVIFFVSFFLCSYSLSSAFLLSLFGQVSLW